MEQHADVISVTGEMETTMLTVHILLYTGGIDGLHAVCMIGGWWVFALCLGFFFHFRVAFCGFGAGVFFFQGIVCFLMNPSVLLGVEWAWAVLVWYAWCVSTLDSFQWYLYSYY